MNQWRFGMKSRLAVAVTLVAAWACFAVGHLIYLADGQPRQLVRHAVADPAGNHLSAIFGLLHSALFILFAVGLVAITVGPGSRLVRGGAVVMAVGMVGHVGQAMFSLLLAGMVGAGIDQATILAAVPSDPTVVGPLMLAAMLGISLGPPLVMAGLWRARRLPVWVAGIYLVADVANVFLPFALVLVVATIPVLITAAGIIRSTHGATGEIPLGLLRAQAEA
jgi:hypothetical protein